ncbi:MAG TPA: DUF4113 domain-containing protein, partial [Gammaproteobacteria bacterium]|nr:DUF4113 domain-containing protein [Gammaproteobacteria bacterium]
AANRVAKKEPRHGGVFDMGDPAGWDGTLAGIDAGDIWGVGPRWAERLAASGIRTASQLRRAGHQAIRRRFGVVLARTVLELDGHRALDLETEPAPRQQIVVSRSFGRPAAAASELREAVTYYATRAAEKLRRQGQSCRSLRVFAHTNGFRPDEPQCHISANVAFAAATQDTRDIAGGAAAAIAARFRGGYRYHKAGVMLLDLAPAGRQSELPLAPASCGDEDRSRRLMAAVDGANRRMGSGTVRLAGQGARQSWGVRAQHRSPRYTTRWSDLPEALA